MYSKEGNVKLETSARFTPIGQTNIVFYNTDINTADLVFLITRNKIPLEVSDENVNCYLMLKAQDSSYIVDTASVEDPMNGKVRYTIPKEFLSHSGNVQAQVWIAVHGKEDIVTEVQFSFEIKDSLVNTVPAVDKVNYIKSFDDLRQRITDRVDEIEEAIKNGADYVAEMDETLQTGKKELNDTVSRNQKTVEELADGTVKTVKETRDQAVEDMKSKSTGLINEAKTNVNATRDKALTDMKEQSEGYVQEAKEAKEGVEQAIENWNFSGTNLLKGTTDEWQESKARFEILLAETSLTAGDTVTYDVETESEAEKNIAFYDADANELASATDTAEIPENTYRIMVNLSESVNNRKPVLNRGIHPADWSLNPSETAAKKDVQQKLDQTFADNLEEHGFLDFESGFKNKNTDVGDEATWLQYIRIGSMCKIFGTIENANLIDKDSEVLVSTLPNHLKVTMIDIATSQASGTLRFTSRIYHDENADYPNGITISRPNNSSGAGNIPAKNWLNISLTCAVGVVE